MSAGLMSVWNQWNHPCNVKWLGIGCKVNKINKPITNSHKNRIWSMDIKSGPKTEPCGTPYLSASCDFGWWCLYFCADLSVLCFVCVFICSCIYLSKLSLFINLFSPLPAPSPNTWVCVSCVNIRNGTKLPIFKLKLSLLTNEDNYTLNTYI